MLCALFITTSAFGADKDPKQEARDRFARGVQLFNENDNQGALAEFLEAYRLSAHPLVLYNIGLTYAAMRHPVKAVSTFEKLLKAPGSVAGERLERARSELKRQQARIAQITLRLDDVEGTPAGVRVEVDGAVIPKALGKPLPLSVGAHFITVSVDGYRSVRREVIVAGATRRTETFRMERGADQSGLVRVVCPVPGADVFVDDKRVGRTPLVSPLLLQAGSRRVEVRRKGYRSAGQTVDVTVRGSGEVNLTPTLDPSQAASNGGVRLDISEPNAVIYVNGAAHTGTATLKLPSGAHRLRVERSGFESYTRNIVVPETGTRSIAITLLPTPEYRADYVSRTTSQRTWGYTALFGGAAIVVGSSAFLFWNAGQISDAEDRFAAVERTFSTGGDCFTGGGKPSNECQTELDLAVDDLDAKRGRTVFGWIGFGTGVAVSALGVYLLATNDDPDRYEPKLKDDPYARLRVIPTGWMDASSGGVGLLGRF